MNTGLPLEKLPAAILKSNKISLRIRISLKKRCLKVKSFLNSKIHLIEEAECKLLKWCLSFLVSVLADSSLLQQWRKQDWIGKFYLGVEERRQQGRSDLEYARNLQRECEREGKICVYFVLLLCISTVFRFSILDQVKYTMRHAKSYL